MLGAGPVKRNGSLCNQRCNYCNKQHTKLTILWTRMKPRTYMYYSNLETVADYLANICIEYKSAIVLRAFLPIGFVRNHWYENVFCPQFHFHANETYFYMKGSAGRLVLKQRHKTTWRWPIHPLPQWLFTGTFPSKSVINCDTDPSNIQ